jgi:hypothetical protein
MSLDLFPSLLTATMDNPIRFNVEIWNRRAATMQIAVIILKQIQDGTPSFSALREDGKSQFSSINEMDDRGATQWKADCPGRSLSFRVSLPPFGLI